MTIPLPFLQTILILLVIGNVQALRGIRLSSEELVSPRVVHVHRLDLNSSTSSSSNTHNSSKCTHPYGFLPCASNIPGYIFQIFVLEYLLLVGDNILTKARQQLFSILGVGIYGATVFRILAVLPTIVLLLASGLAQNKEAAQVRIENGAGSLAGSTVFYLTLQWGICVLLGRTKITKESSPLPQQESSRTSTPAGCFRVKRGLSILKDYGVETDTNTRYTAGIMLLSLIPFIFVEVASKFKSPPWSLIMTLTLTVAALVSYFVFQSRHQWIQEMSLEYSRDQLLLAGFVDHLQKIAKRTLINDEGNVDPSCIRRTFREIDKDKNDHISKAELREFLAKMKSGDHLDEKFAIEELMKHFDQDSDHLITVDEFLDGCQKYVQNAKKLVADKTDSSKKYFPGLHRMVKPWINKSKKKLLETEEHLSKVLNTSQNKQLACLITDGKPDDDKIRSLFAEFDKDGDKKMTPKELKEMILSKFGSEKLDLDDLEVKMMKAFDMNKDSVLHEGEFLDGFKKRLTDGTTTSQLVKECIQDEKRSIKKLSKRSLLKALLGVGLGIAIVSSLGIPLVNNTQLLSERLGISSFFISFVVLPFAVNFKTAMATIYAASQKKEKASSIMFSEIYGAVFMNNTLGLLTLVALIWARGFSWEFSAEVLVLMVVSGIIGLMGYCHRRYPFWTCILAFSFYPLSLLLFYVIRFLVGWK